MHHAIPKRYIQVKFKVSHAGICIDIQPDIALNPYPTLRHLHFKKII